MYISPTPKQDSPNYWWLHIKKRGNLPVTRPTNRGSGIALTDERATPKPTPICKSALTASKPMMAKCNTDVGYYIPMGVFAAMFLTVSWWNCQIPIRQAQSVKYAFPIYRSSSLCFHPCGLPLRATPPFTRKSSSELGSSFAQVGLRHQSENRCKDSEYFLNYNGKGSKKTQLQCNIWKCER